MEYVDEIYEYVKKESEGLDSIYGDYIVKLVGISGLNALAKNHLIESCGLINGRQLWVLCDKKGKGEQQ